MRKNPRNVSFAERGVDGLNHPNVLIADDDLLFQESYTALRSGAGAQMICFGAIVQPMDWNDFRFVLAVQRGMSRQRSSLARSAWTRRRWATYRCVGRKPRLPPLRTETDGLAPTARGARVVASAEKMSTEVASLAADLAHETGLTRVTVRLTRACSGSRPAWSFGVLASRRSIH